MEWFKNRKEKEQFISLMNYMDLPGYQLAAHKRIESGHVLYIYIPPTSSFEEFENKKARLRDYFKSYIELEKIDYSNVVKLVAIRKPPENFNFEPQEPPNVTSFYLGKLFTLESFFLDLRYDPHILIVGLTQTGKSTLMAIIMTNLMYHKEQAKNFELYLCQTHKRDIDYLKDFSIVKNSVYTPKETAALLENAINEINRRANLFAEWGIKGIEHYNEVMDRKMKRRVYLFEEISLFMPDETDSQEEKEDKSKVWPRIWKLVKLGAEVGIHFIGLTQRSTAANLGGSGEIKSQLARITYQQAQAIDSTNVIDTADATQLREHEVFVRCRKGLKRVKVPYAGKFFSILHEYVPEIKIFNLEKFKELKYEPEEVKFEHIAIDPPPEVEKIEPPVEEAAATITKKPKPKSKKGLKAL